MRKQRTIRVLGIETSCDETAAAVVHVDRHTMRGELAFEFCVRSNIIASQIDLHAQYGGVVPEVAAREHVVRMIPVIEEALRNTTENEVPKNGKQQSRSSVPRPSIVLRDSIDAIAVTAGPGLMTSLAVGVETARALAFAWEKPLIAVNHIEGHILSAVLPHRGEEHVLRSSFPRFPLLALVVSGGHTELLLSHRWGSYECIGATRDDAAGEAFDKIGKLLGLPYPGGPAVARAAETGNAEAFDFPRPMIDREDFEFSFSGLKTAVRYAVERKSAPVSLPDVCASFQRAVIDVLVAKTVRAAQRYGARTVLLGGGVAANQLLRSELAIALAQHAPGVALGLPDPAYTGDNAAMIAAAGGVRALLGKTIPRDRMDADANWELGR